MTNNKDDKKQKEAFIEFVNILLLGALIVLVVYTIIFALTK